MNPDYPTGSLQQPAKSTTDQLSDQVRQTSGEVTERARETARHTMDNQKGRMADTVGTIADALRQTGDHLDEQDQGQFSQFAHTAADRLEQFADNLQHKSVDEIFGDVENFARREPQLFLGGALVLGLLASRFFKSSASRSQYAYGRSQRGYTGQRYPYGPEYGANQSYYRGTSERPLNEADLASYRREAMDNDYTRGTPRTGDYGLGETGTSTQTPGQSSGASTLSGSSGQSSGSSGSQGFNTPPSTKPGERPNPNPPQRTDE